MEILEVVNGENVYNGENVDLLNSSCGIFLKHDRYYHVSNLMKMATGIDSPNTIVSVERLQCSVCGREFIGSDTVVDLRGDGFTGSKGYDINVTVNLCSAECKSDRVDFLKNKSVQDEVSKWKKRVSSDHIGYASFCGVGMRHASCNLDNYDGDTSMIDKWLESPTENLLVQSTKAGNGKTHLAVAALKAYASSDKCDKIKALYVSFSEFMSDLKSTFSNDLYSEKDVIDGISNVDLLIIDDIGTEKVSDYVQNTLYIILNKRYENMKPTIMTTNMNSKEITANYGSRMLSRMVSGVMMQVDGSDNRMTKVHTREVPLEVGKRSTIWDFIKK